MHQGASTVEISIAELRALVNCSKPFPSLRLAYSVPRNRQSAL
jgi:hypothetical protein